MSLLLTLQHGPRSQAVRETRLDQGQLIIGRSSDADWQIDDPDMYVSRAHCTVSARSDGYFVTDTSSSGLFIDDAGTPLGAGNTARLHDGMRLRLGDYVVGVELRNGAGQDVWGAGAADLSPTTPAELGADTFFSAAAEEPPSPKRPAGLPDPFEKEVAGSFAAYQRQDADHRRSQAFDDPFSLDPAAAGPGKARSDDWGDSAPNPPDPFGFGAAAEPARAEPEQATPGFEFDAVFAAAPEAGTDDPPAPIEPAPIKNEPTPAYAPWELPPEEADPAGRAAGADGAPSSPQPQQVRAEPAPIAAAAPVAEQRQPPRVRPMPDQARAGDDADLHRAFLRGLGVEPAMAGAGDAAAQMERFGREYRLMLEGLMQLLRKRAEEKGNARVAQTVVGASDVNPLKFMPTVDDALSIVMRDGSPGFLSGEAAIVDSVRDLAQHHIRAWRGVQAALRRMVDRFDPVALEKELQSASALGNLLSGGKNAKLWELYRKRHRDIAQSAEDRFLGEIGADFRDAYEEE